MIYGYKIISLCTTQVYDTDFCDFISHFNDELTKHGWRILIYTSDSNLEKKSISDKGKSKIYDLIDYERTDIMIVFPGKIRDDTISEELYLKAAEYSIPVITINGSHENSYNINYDSLNGIEEMAEHLIKEHGVRSFHFIAGIKDNEFSDSRIYAMKKVMDKNCIPFDDSMISYGDFWADPARKAVKKLIDEKRLPEAIVCANDAMAVAVCSELMQNGYSVPDDVIVTGYDGTEYIKHSIPKISSVKCSGRIMGLKSAETVFDIYENKPEYYDVLIKPELKISESCGCIRHTPANSVDFINYLNGSLARYHDEDMILNEISDKIIACHNANEIDSVLYHPVFYSVQCLLKKECMDHRLDPLRSHTKTTFGEELYVLLDTDNLSTEKDRYMNISSVTPGLDKIFLNQEPVIFTAVTYLDTAIGFLAFHFESAKKAMRTNYLKIGQIASALGYSITGYRNTKYQQYLTSVVEDSYQYDSLTGLLNRNKFFRKYKTMIEEQKPSEVTLILCDLDGLKHINDTFSHTEGDNAIAVAAHALSEALNCELNCRYGGDELIAVIPYRCDAETIISSINSRTSKYNKTSGKPYEVSVSIGVYTSSETDFAVMLQEADKLMYLDKRTKKYQRA